MKRGQRDVFPPVEMYVDLKLRVRDLRYEATPAETKLWAAIRDGKLGYRFEKQSPRERFLDFFCPEAKLAVEVEGHVRTAAEDEARLAGLEARGVRLLRFTNDDVLKNLEGVALVIAEAAEQAVPLSLTLPRKGGGDPSASAFLTDEPCRYCPSAHAPRVRGSGAPSGPWGPTAIELAEVWPSVSTTL